MIRGQTRPVRNVNVNLDFSIHNRFDIEVIDASTGEVKQKAVGYNTICDQLWTRMFQPNTYFSYIFYGTGSGTPSSSDTSLFSHSGYKAVSLEYAQINPSEDCAYQRGSIQLTSTEAVGVTITEVGIAYGTSASNLVTHAMLQDMNGNAISITKTDTDIVNIYATVYMHFDTSGDDNGSIFFLWNGDADYGAKNFGNPINRGTQSAATSNFFYWIMRGYGNFKNCQAIVAPDVGCAGAYSDQSPTFGPLPALQWYAVGKPTYTLSSADRTLTITLPRVDSANGNFTNKGIAKVMLWLTGSASGTNGNQCHLAVYCKPESSWFPGTNIIGESVGTGDGATTDFSLDFPWARNAKIYVDGVEASNVTVDYGINETNVNPYLEFISNMSTPDNIIRRHMYATGSGHPGYDSGLPVMWYNPMWAQGIATLYTGDYSAIYASDDLEDWDLVAENTTSTTSKSYTVAEEYRHRKYWKLVSKDASSAYCALRYYAMTLYNYTGKVVHFSEPPASGAVITADYDTHIIGKDADHVLDISITIRLNEYTEG